MFSNLSGIRNACTIWKGCGRMSQIGRYGPQSANKMADATIRHNCLDLLEIIVEYNPNLKRENIRNNFFYNRLSFAVQEQLPYSQAIDIIQWLLTKLNKKVDFLHKFTHLKDAPEYIEGLIRHMFKFPQFYELDKKAALDKSEAFVWTIWQQQINATEQLSRAKGFDPDLLRNYL